MAKDATADIVHALNDSPLFQRLLAGLDYQRVGLQLHRRGRTEQEYTALLRAGKLHDLLTGLQQQEFVIRIDLETWDRINTPEEAAWMKAHPLEAVRKYWPQIEMPLRVKLRLGARLLLS